MEVIEERINDLKGRSIEIIKTELQRQKDWKKKKKKRSSGICERILRSLTFMSSRSQKESKKKAMQKMFEEIMAGNFPNLM